MNSLGNKEIMSQNIQFYMDRLRIDRKDLSRAINVPYTTVCDWVNCKTYPRIDKIESMANYFNVSKSDLVEEHSSELPATVIPVLGSVAAGIPIDAITDIIDYEEITESMARSGNYYGLKVKGDSMYPTICNGDVVIVRMQEDAENGDTVIVTVNGDEATCKKLKKFPGGIILIPNNPAYEPFSFSEAEVQSMPIRIIGKVVELRRKF